MTSRQRVLSAMQHRQGDRVPIDFSAHRSSGIAAIAYPKLRSYLGLEPKPVRVYDVVQQLAIVDEDVLERFGVDTIELGRGFALDEQSWKPWVLPDGTECLIPAWTPIERDNGRWVIKSKNGRVIGQMPDGTLYFETAYWPFQNGGDPARLDDVPAGMWALAQCPPGPVTDEQLAAGAKRLRQKTDRAIIGLFGGSLFQAGHGLYRDDNWMMMLAAEPHRAHHFLDMVMQKHLANLEKFLGLVGNYIDIIHFVDDLGMQTGPVMSPAMYREFFKPRHTALFSRAKQLCNVKVMLHCCGGLRELMGDLIEAGVDAVNPVQINCRGMDAAELKCEFGRDITFWGGGCDTGEVLPDGSLADIAEHVKKQVAILAPGGGFVFQQVHNIMANVPPENIVAMFDAVNPMP